MESENLKLKQRLEPERQERLKLAQDVAPRWFRFQDVHPKLKLFAGMRFAVWTVEDPEAERLARLLEQTLREAGWQAVSPLMVEQNVNSFDEGVWLDFSLDPPGPARSWNGKA